MNMWHSAGRKVPGRYFAKIESTLSQIRMSILKSSRESFCGLGDRDRIHQVKAVVAGGPGQPACPETTLCPATRGQNLGAGNSLRDEKLGQRALEGSTQGML